MFSWAQKMNGMLETITFINGTKAMAKQTVS